MEHALRLHAVRENGLPARGGVPTPHRLHAGAGDRDHPPRHQPTETPRRQRRRLRLFQGRHPRDLRVRVQEDAGADVPRPIRRVQKYAHGPLWAQSFLRAPKRRLPAFPQGASMD